MKDIGLEALRLNIIIQTEVSKFEKTKVMKRYMVIVVVLTLLGLAVIGKAGYTMTAKKEYWTQVADRLKSDSDSVRPNRGNIFSCDGQLLASSIPEYKIFMDYQAGGGEDTAWVRQRDSIWAADLDSLCRGLHEIFPDKSAAEFRQRLVEGKQKRLQNGTVGARHWPVWRRKISYNTFCEVRQLPYFNLPPNKGGFHWEKFEARRRPFGTLAERTIGDIRSFEGGKDTARFGIELSYDSILRGHHGLERKQKVLNKFVNITLAPPVDGADVITTIDVGMQDLAEQALLEELHKDNASMGVAILMEVQTGDVKAIVNMRKGEDGIYREIYNDAISYRCEPGSVFKTASTAATATSTSPAHWRSARTSASAMSSTTSTARTPRAMSTDSIASASARTWGWPSRAICPRRSACRIRRRPTRRSTGARRRCPGCQLVMRRRSRPSTP